VILPIEPDCGERGRYEFLERVGDARSNNEVVGLVALKHSPHRVDVVGSPAPIAANREVAEGKPLSAPRTDSGRCRGDLAGHEAARPKGRFVIEQKSGTSEEAVGLAVIGH
jgi:hypothetical protein